MLRNVKLSVDLFNCLVSLQFDHLSQRNEVEPSKLFHLTGLNEQI